MKKDSGLNREAFNEDDLVLVGHGPGHSLEEFEIGATVELGSGGPDMWVLAIHGEKIECGWIAKNDKAYSELFSYQCLKIKESEYK